MSCFNDIRDTIMGLTYKANVDIDSAKHASEKRSKQSEQRVKEITQMPLPSFVRYGKAVKRKEVDPMHDPNNEEWFKKCCHTNSFLDLHCDYVLANTEETLTVDGLEDMNIDLYNGIIPQSKRIPGLTAKGKWDIEQKKYIGAGLWNELCFADPDRWTYKAFEHPECKTSIELHAIEAREIMKKYIEDYNKENGTDFTWIDVYANVTRFTFCTTMSTGYKDSCATFFFAVFANDMLEYMLDYIGQEALDMDLESDFDEE